MKVLIFLFLWAYLLLLNSSQRSCSVQLGGMFRACQTAWRGVLSSTEEESWNGGKPRGRKGPGRQWTASRCREAELNNKNDSCVSLAAKQTPWTLFFYSCRWATSVNKNWQFFKGFNMHGVAFCHCLQNFTAVWRNMISFLCILLSGNTQEKAAKVSSAQHR